MNIENDVNREELGGNNGNIASKREAAMQQLVARYQFDVNNLPLVLEFDNIEDLNLAFDAGIQANLRYRGSSFNI